MPTNDRHHEQIRMWALVTEIFGRSLKGDIIHSYIMVNMGEVSVTDLTDDQLDEVIKWLELIPEASS